MNTTYAHIFGIVLLLACAAPEPVMAEGPAVSQTIVVDVQNNLSDFLEMFRRTRVEREKMQLKGQARVLSATFASPPGTVAIAVDFPDMATLAQEVAAMEANPDMRAIWAEYQDKFRPISRMIHTDITPK